jgi:phosphoribosyl 1,2-cyclic phosphodiesterase
MSGPSPKYRIAEVEILKVCVLASSSSGNCTLVTTEKTRILVDAGLSRKETFTRLAAAGEDPAKLDAILISHEHSDHVAGLPVLAKSLRAPVFLTDVTAEAVVWNDTKPVLEKFQAGARLVIGDIEIDTFTVPHDAADPVGFCFRTQGLRFGMVTDLGYLPENVKYNLRRTDILLLESNHDLEMLKVGPYPWAVKQRVMGRRGHLSNDVASGFVAEAMDTGTQTLILGHLSQNNNHPELVRLAATQALARRELCTRLVIARPGVQSEVFLL